MEHIIPSSNCCTTECNHTFHSSCLFKNFSTSPGCPLCRKELVSFPEEDDESNYESDEEDYNYNPSFTKEQIYAVIKKKGYNESDFMNSIILSHHQNTSLIPMEEDMWVKHEKLFELLTSILIKEIAVDYRDSRTYASVIQGSKKVDKVGEGPKSIF
jgi:hypothetical protein